MTHHINDQQKTSSSAVRGRLLYHRSQKTCYRPTRVYKFANTGYWPILTFFHQQTRY